MCARLQIVVLVCIFFSSVSLCHTVNKYSKEANQPELVGDGDKESWKNMDKPYRVAKINLIWAKAQKVHSS